MDCSYRNDVNDNCNDIENEVLISSFGNEALIQETNLFVDNSLNGGFGFGFNSDFDEQDDISIFKEKAEQKINNENISIDDEIEVETLKKIDQKLEDEEKPFIVFTKPTEKYKELADTQITTTFNKDFQQKLKEEENQNYKRKAKPDDMRKKIKVNFFKTLRKGTNQKIKEAGSKDYFEALNQGFISNISKSYNRPFILKTWNDLLHYKFPNGKQSDTDKYEHNLNILKKIEDDQFPEVKTKYDTIGNLTIYQLFEEYLRSEEYLESLYQVQLKEKDFYLERYRELAKNFVDFFLKDK